MGSPKQSIIEVNGKRYDARTGRLISQPVAQAAAKKARPVQDFIRTSAASATKARRTPQRSQTLMRTGVKRPAPAPRPVSKTAKPRPVSDFKPMRPAAKRALLPAKNETARLVRASTVKQSKLVRKFGDMIQQPSLVPVARRVEALAVQPMPAQHGPLALRPAKSKMESLLEKGLQNAQSHKQAPAKRSKSRRKAGRLATYGAGALSALLLAGFIAYQSIPNIAVRYASTRAGVMASLPGYQPNGFALSNRIKYNPGQITLEYSSNADERSYSVTQRESNWNSDTLASNYVAEKSDQVQRYEDKGRTIYLYGESNATWVSNGVWYEVKGDSKLTSDQLIRIATSL